MIASTSRYLTVLTATIMLFFGGCGMYKKPTPAETQKMLHPKNTLLNNVKQTKIKNSYILMHRDDKLSYTLERLGNLTHNYYVLRGKDIDIKGVKNYRIHNFDELSKYVSLLTDYKIKITKNRFRKNAPKIVKVFEKRPSTILDKIVFDSKNIQVPAHIFSSLSNYANGWRIIDRADAKKLFNAKQYINFKGTLRDFIDYFASNNNLFVDYNYDKKEIIYSKYKTKHFPLKIVTEKYQFKNNIQADIDSSISDKKSEGSIKVDSEYDILKSLRALLDKIIDKANGEYYSILEANNELVVKTTPNKLKTIEQVVANINATALKQIDIKITVYDVSLSKQYQYGINWGYVNQKLNSLGDVTSTTVFSSNSIVPTVDTTLTAPTIFKYTGEGLNSLISLLNTFGNTVLSYQIPLKTTNNIPAVCNLANKEGYVSKFTIDTTNDSNQVSIEQDSVTGGQYVYLKPTLLGNEILMSLKMVFGNINDIVKQEFDNGQYIQTPNLSKNAYNQNIVLHSGDRIVIGGITQRYKKKGYNGMSDEKNILSPLLGVKNTDTQNKETVIIIEANVE